MRRRYKSLFLVLAFLLALVPRMARADTFIGTTERGANEGEDSNIAACLACGENYLTMDSGLRAALFGSTVDGGEGTTSAPNFPKFAYFRDTCYMNEFTDTMKGRAWSRLNDFTYAWALSDARADLQRALRMWQSDGTESGGTGGGGGDDVEGSVPLNIPVTAQYSDLKSGGYYSYKVRFNGATGYTFSTLDTDMTLVPSSITVSISAEQQQILQSELTDETKMVCIVGSSDDGTGTNNPRYIIVRFLLINNTSYSMPSGNFTSRSERGIYIDNSVRLRYADVAVGDTLYQTIDITDKTINFNKNQQFNGGYYSLNWGSAYFGAVGDDGEGGGGTGGGEFGDDDDDNVFNPTNPPDDTPTKPTSPTQPIVTPTEPNYNIYIDNSTTTTTADLTPILEAIRILNDNLVAGFENVEEAISTCCENMRAFLDAWFAHFSDLIENFSDNVDDWFNWFSQKLYKWLKQIDDDINTSSSQIQSWLQMIYNRMNGGGSTVPNPDTQTDDYFDWWDYFIKKLLGLLPDGVSDFLDVLGGLKEVFPFSVPWDVGLILGIFAADPVTPVFDVQLPTYAASGGWQLVPVHVDLTPWDGVAQLVRSGVLLVFAYYLALWTRDGLRHFEV